MENRNRLLEYIDGLNFQGEIIKVCKNDDAKIIQAWLELSRLLGDDIGIENLDGPDSIVTPLVFQDEPGGPLHLLILAYIAGRKRGYVAVRLDNFIGLEIFPILNELCENEYTVCKVTQTIYAQIQLFRKWNVISEDIRLDVAQDSITFNLIESLTHD